MYVFLFLSFLAFPFKQLVCFSVKEDLIAETIMWQGAASPIDAAAPFSEYNRKLFRKARQNDRASDYTELTFK